MTDKAIGQSANLDHQELEGHAYHYNLPPQFFDENDGVPLVTNYAYRKAQTMVEVAYSIKLSEELFEEKPKNVKEGQSDDMDEDTESEVDENESEIALLVQKCNRLSSLFSSLKELKFGGVLQLDLCQILVHLLRLLTATVVVSKNDNGIKTVQINYDRVGYVYDTIKQQIIYDGTDNPTGDQAIEMSEEYLEQDFALPTPAREILLGVVMALLSTDSLYRTVSNTSFRVPEESFQTPYNGELLIVIEWKALLRMLLRTAPYLDENKEGRVPMDSLSRQNTILRHTVIVVRYLRKFYDQGLNVKENILTDRTAKEVWEMVKPDLLYEIHSNASYRSLILLYLFQPSRSSRKFYTLVVPQWLESWTTTDRCPDSDYLWLTMFCRARKYLESEDFDWGPIRTRLLTLCGYWLQIPVGGKSSDKSFPNANGAKSRSIPARLKAFIGNGSSYKESVDFVSKLAKLLIFCLGRNDGIISQVGGENKEEDIQIQDTTTSLDGNNNVSDGTTDVLKFLAFVTPYYHPSNIGNWTFPLGVLLHYLCYELCRRLGRGVSQNVLSKRYPLLSRRICEIEPYKRTSLIPEAELILLLDALLSLCQQALYSRNERVSRAGDSALLYLTQIDQKICPLFLDFSIRALDISSVTLSHQAPAALSVLAKLIHPTMKSNPIFFLERLPDILRLTLPGIDSNDQDKTIRTLIFYRSLTSWIPIGEDKPSVGASRGGQSKGTWSYGNEIPEYVRGLTETEPYCAELRKLPEHSLLHQAEASYQISSDDQVTRLSDLFKEAQFALEDWLISFLERIYDIFRSAGEQEKVGKSFGIATRHSSADASQAKHFNMILKQCLFQVFASLDDKNFETAVRSVESFLRNESLPLASKFSQILCEAVCAIRSCDDGRYHSPGLDILIPCLTENLASKSKATVLYRIRSLAGAVRLAGPSVLKYKIKINSVLVYALSEVHDKNIFKAGCKFLRHLLGSQCECYPMMTEYGAYFSHGILGKTPLLESNSVKWHVPNGEQIDYSTNILKSVVLTRFNGLFTSSGIVECDAVDLLEWRCCLKLLKYSLRGSMSMLQESDVKVVSSANIDNFHPHEIFFNDIAKSASKESWLFIFTVREILCNFIGLLLALIANGSEVAVDGDSRDSVIQKRSLENVIASDVKVCKETSLIASLLSVRRGAYTNCVEQKSIWKLQKSLADDRMLSTARKEISSVMRKCGEMKPPSTLLYCDGEEGGKSLPRRMIVSRVFLFFQSLQRDCSFEIPRRLRRKGKSLRSGEHLFDFKTGLSTLNAFINSSFDFAGNTLSNENRCNLHLYERITDGSFALACHTSAQIRSLGYRLAENLFSRYGWFANERVSRLVSSLLLCDSNQKGEHGVLSCVELISVNTTANRKRLSDVLKGVSNLLHIGKVVKQITFSEKHRLNIVKVLCRSQQVIALLPPEEMQKMTHYYHSIFSKLRSKYFSLYRIGKRSEVVHRKCLDFLINTIREKGKSQESSNDITSVHWRDRLMSGWFLLTIFDKEDMTCKEELVNNLWDSCFNCLLEESGQPIQKLSLGLIGRLCALSHSQTVSILQSKMTDELFCVEFCKALVYNHREDSSIAGSNKAQWSVGIDAVLKDSQTNIAPRIIFPFKRMGRGSATVMIPHAQLLNNMLSLLEEGQQRVSADFFLKYAVRLASSPPSEDQRNEICTSAEIFAGISIALLSKTVSNEEISDVWNSLLLPFFNDVMDVIPISALASYSDAARFILQCSNRNQQKPLTMGIIAKIEEKLWRRGLSGNEANTASTDGFTEQSKWIGIMCAVLIELDNKNNNLQTKQWYLSAMTKKPESNAIVANELNAIVANEGDNDFETFWSEITSRLVPLMLGALAHPYQKCREQIAWCLFCICNCYIKFLQQSKRCRHNVQEKNIVNPGTSILKTLCGLKDTSEYSPKELQLCLTTTRFFIFYCLHYGDNKFEYATFILPLLSLAFEAVRPEGQGDEDDVESDVRMLQAQVIKGYRYTIAEIGASCFMTYNNSDDISKVLQSLDNATHHDSWQVRHTATHFLRCFQGCHKFLLTEKQLKKTTRIITQLLADERKEVSAAAMSALTGILASTLTNDVEIMVDKYVRKANKSVIKKTNKRTELVGTALENEFKRAIKQQTSVYFLCAAVLSRPYDTPKFAPKALAALSKHSFERTAPFTVREAVKLCCREYKRTHMTDNWVVHKQQFTQEQLEALDDVVSTPHYYA